MCVISKVKSLEALYLTMLVLIAVLALGTAARGAPRLQEPLYDGYNYHQLVGIDTAARIKASEQALDFDGTRIIGGSLARLGEFPFMAGTIILLNSGRESFCGASLISSSRLTTAAHCWTDGWTPARLLTVVLGSLQLFSGGTRLVTSRVTAHPQFSPGNLNNDIAVIAIDPVALTPHINPIKLPDGDDDYVGVVASAVGYGRTDNFTFDYRLRHVGLPVISNEQCMRSFHHTWVRHGTVCAATGGGRSTCFGDSGGPLQDPEENILIGVTSFIHRSGCLGGHPAGFTRVSAFVPWIRNLM